MGNKVYILKYLRKGLINNVKTEENVVPGATRAQLDINLKFQAKDVRNGRTEKMVLPGNKIELLGPADVKSVNKRAISHISPAESGDVRLNASYRPYMEFYEEDLPWRYTPFAPTSSDFYPWIRLIAVKQDECVVSFRNGVKIARINLTEERIKEVFATNNELSKSAHAQIDVEDSFQGTLDQETVNQMLDDNPDCGISRVLCMSKLEPGTQYMLLLVPTYEQGRLSALGMSLDGVNMNVLVTPQPNSEFELPIYYKWRCITATHEGTFKALADKLNFTPAEDYKKMEANLTVDISQSGLKTVSFDKEKKIDVPAALVMNTTPYNNIDDEGKNYRTELQKHLSLNPVFDENELEEVNQEQDPWVVPPVYGARHLMTKRADFEKGPDAGVVNEVNLKLQNRIVAGMGGSVVMNNQEEFVNRAWKKVEVVNVLNQMLREYYQMNKVNDCAKGMNSRSSIDKSVLNKQNQGLISDAALRMLQTSGIYYNNVAPDTMLDHYNEMHVKDSGTVYAGMSKDYLAQLYDHDMWKEIIDNDNKYDIVSGLFKDNKAWDEDGMSDIDFLKGLFETAIIDGKARFIAKDEDEEKFNVVPKSLIMSEDWQTIRSILNDKSDELDMAKAYNIFKGLKDSYETFNDMRISGFSALGKNKSSASSMRPYPISVTNPYGHTFIVPDECFKSLVIKGNNMSNRPLAVEYYAKKNDKKPSYFFIVPKSCLDSMSHKYHVRVEGTLFDVDEINGKFGFENNNSTAATVLEQYRPQTSYIFWHITQTQAALSRTNATWVISEPLVDTKYEYKNTSPYFQIKFYNGEYSYMTSLRNTGKNKYKWMKWTYGSFTKSFMREIAKDNGDVAILYFVLPEYRKVLETLRLNMLSLESLLLQPTDVSISLYEQDPRCVLITAEELMRIVLENVKKDNDISPANNQELLQIQNEVDNQRNRIETELKTKLEPTGPNLMPEPLAIDVIDPDQLAKDRIKELAEKYGVTEYNQLEGRLHDKYPVMIHPDFLDPTYFYLRELSVDYVLPASGNLAKNTISCFYSNQAFEEAFLMGMNTEMGRELMWREYPTDQRGSYFRKFWDQAELPKKEELTTKYYDIEDIDKWKGKLGQNHKAGKTPMLVFAIKGELMQTFPDTDVFLQSIGTPGKKNNNVQIKKKDMASWLTSDTYLVGFCGVKKEDLKNYLLVFQQKPLSLQFSQQAEGKNNPYGIVNPQCYLMRAL